MERCNFYLKIKFIVFHFGSDRNSRHVGRGKSQRVTCLLLFICDFEDVLGCLFGDGLIFRSLVRDRMPAPAKSSRKV